MPKWVAGLVVMASIASACGGDAVGTPVTVRDVACTVPPAVRESVKTALGAGELERAERRLTRARVSCPTDAWIDETAKTIHTAFETDHNGDALAVLADSATDAAEASRNRDRALRAYEREEHVAARVVASEAPASDTVQYSPHGAWVHLADVIVDARTGRVAKHVAADVEVTFSPNDAAATLVDAYGLTVIDLATGAVTLRHAGAHPALTWSDDARFVAWAGSALWFADVTTGNVQSLASGAYDVVRIGRGVVAGASEDHGLVVHRLVAGDRVAQVAHVESWAFDRSRDRIVFLDAPQGALRELDLASGKIRSIPFRSPRYAGMCGETATWSIVGLDGDALHLFRDCSGVDEGSYDLKTQKVSLSTTADGDAIGISQDMWARIDKTHFDDIADVDFTSARITMSPDDRSFAGLDQSGRARVWTKAGKVIWAGPARPEELVAVVSSGHGRVDGSEILTYTHAGELRRWNAKTGALVATHALPQCVFRSLAVRDDGEGVVTCVSDDKARVYREGSSTPLVERALRDTAENVVLDQRGAYVTFEPAIGKPLDVVALDGTRRTTARALPAGGQLLAAAGDVLLMRNPSTSELTVWAWSTSSQLVSIPITGARASYTWHDWTALVGRGRYLADERIDHVDVWSIGAKAATQLMTLSPSPPSLRALAIASDDGPVMVRGSTELVTWTSPHKTHATPIAGGVASLDFSDALHLFVVAHATSATLEDGVTDPAMELFAIPYTKTAAAIDRVQNTVTLTGDPKLASDLLACRIGKRTVPFGVCVSRWVE